MLDNQVIQRAHSVTIESVLERRRIKLSGKLKNKVGPCPKCGGTDRFGINTELQLFNCRHCKKGGDVIDLVQFLDNVDFAEACTILTGEPVAITNGHAALTSSDNSTQRTKQAVEIWHGAQDPQGTLAEAYLQARKLILPPEVCGNVLRFSPACPWGTIIIPCLVAAFRSIITNNITGIHRIRLDQPQQWPKAERKMLGVVAASAIKLDPVSESLVVSEGLESALAARQLGFKPIWALGSAVGIGNFEPVDGVNELLILGERDSNGSNQKAAHECTSQWAGRTMLLMPPAEYKDLNDMLMGNKNVIAA